MQDFFMLKEETVGVISNVFVKNYSIFLKTVDNSSINIKNVFVYDQKTRKISGVSPSVISSFAKSILYSNTDCKLVLVNNNHETTIIYTPPNKLQINIDTNEYIPDANGIHIEYNYGVCDMKSFALDLMRMICDFVELLEHFDDDCASDDCASFDDDAITDDNDNVNDNDNDDDAITDDDDNDDDDKINT